MVKDLNAYVSKDTLKINVENLGELKELIEEVQTKEKDLAIAVERLRRFDLKVRFSD